MGLGNIIMVVIRMRIEGQSGLLSAYIRENNQLTRWVGQSIEAPILRSMIVIYI